MGGRMNFLIPYIPILLQGIAVTIAAWLIASTLSLAIGSLLGMISSNYLTSPLAKRTIRAYCFIAKGIPAYVLILIAYFVIPALTAISIPGFIAAVGALAFSSSGYVTEMVRGGINSISRGQWDAAYVLGYTIPQTLYRIVVPQAFKTMLPSLFGEAEQLLKSTSLLATIGITELTRTGINIISRELNPIPIYVTIAGIYLLISGIIQCVQWASERELKYD